ncbi:MAG: N-acetylneuraminate synthase family protein [Bacteroidetes bacterium]|nr:N-acetylneuraminate synthase family protein [Bacteroidota bacterium]MBL7104066.1 N-acetylneuraminate synthase family protein [Bacteroidales bacterium]
MEPTYIIGEIGQNHNGEVEIAKKLIDVVAIPVIDELFGQKLKPLDAIKLTKRDLDEELSASAMLKPYNNPYSFGKTYGEHRAFLELSDEEHFEIYKYVKDIGLDFVETLCARGCLSIFRYFQPDKLKVASRDLTNLPLLEVLAETKVPIILSTGMGGKKELDNALHVISKYHSDITILHCLSQYPSEYKNINLNTILFLKENYPEYTIGYSDHSIGIVVPVAAVAIGAKVIEKHITLDRNMKGTDHKGSLGPDGLFRMVRDIRNIEMAVGVKEIFTSDSVNDTRIKLERSIAAKQNILKGDTIKEENLHLLSPGDGFRWVDKDKVIGMVAKENILKDEIIHKNMIE